MIHHLYERDYSSQAQLDAVVRYIEDAGGVVYVWGNSSVYPVYSTRSRIV